MKKIPEQVVQQECYTGFHNKYCLKYHNPRLIIHSVPNGVSIAIPQQEKARVLDQLKKTGMTNGISDLIIWGVNGRALMAECKTIGGVQSESQKEIQNRLELLGGRYIIFYTVADFWEQIHKNINWLKGEEL